MSEKLEKNYQKIMHSFLDLLKENPYNKVSIQMIAKHSGMTRVNFYKYFSDKEDLLWKTFLYLFLEVEEKVKELDPITLLSEGKPITYYAFQHIKKNQYFYKNILDNDPPFHFKKNLLSYLTEQSFRTHKVLRSQYKGKIPYHRINEYLSGALFYLIYNIIHEEDFDSLELSNFFTSLAVGGLQNYIKESASV
ncbi:MAG: TetR/AcrR family transcriptional regulator [Leptospiraceae bacterium]|nr:TetR/AcrR family transcriptional regulator [Leptospiraceae bacterium]